MSWGYITLLFESSMSAKENNYYKRPSIWKRSYSRVSVFKRCFAKDLHMRKMHRKTQKSCLGFMNWREEAFFLLLKSFFFRQMQKIGWRCRKVENNSKFIILHSCCGDTLCILNTETHNMLVSKRLKPFETQGNLMVEPHQLDGD